MAKLMLARRQAGAYCNWDDVAFRRQWAKAPSAIVPALGGGVPMVVLDEIHKATGWNLWTDTGEGTFELCYLRNKEKQEIDFLIVRDRRPWLPVEVKLTDVEPSPNWRKFLPALKCSRSLQLVSQPGVWREHMIGDACLIVASASEALTYLP